MTAKSSEICADLHTHSTSSDGEWEPEALVDYAAGAGLKALALTDHDSLAGVMRAQIRGQRLGLEVIAGCELTAYMGNVEWHILALFVDPGEYTPLATLLKGIREFRRKRALEMGAKLRVAGVNVPDEEILAAAGSADAIGRPHVAAALVKLGHARNIRDGIRKFLRKDGVAEVPKMQLGPEELFAAIHGSGGIALLAHPGLFPHDELIAPLFRMGMDGIEALYHRHGNVNRRFYEQLARRYEKGISGGSDFHGPKVRPGVMPGAGGVSRVVLEDLRKRAAERKPVRPCQEVALSV